MRLSDFLKKNRITHRQLGEALESPRAKSTVDRLLIKANAEGVNPPPAFFKATLRILRKREKEEKECHKKRLRELLEQNQELYRILRKESSGGNL